MNIISISLTPLCSKEQVYVDGIFSAHLLLLLLNSEAILCCVIDGGGIHYCSSSSTS